ncbi:unnamed protein product [Phytophthora lilii]|uniref:Unnamed protein product n=1 Tax=Phytophthora lilii TaxID=2077276 RepID=A0A9W6U9N8_9STRA|nr:unnamed protein product [Phytophthora lilii]
MESDQVAPTNDDWLFGSDGEDTALNYTTVSTGNDAAQKFPNSRKEIQNDISSAVEVASGDHAGKSSVSVLLKK